MAQPNAVFLKDYAPPDYRIGQVDLHFDLDPRRTLVRARLAVARNPASGRSSPPLVLDGRELELVELRLDGVALPPERYQLDAGQLTLPDVPARFQLEITTAIRPQDNTSLEGLYLSGGNFCTQCEAEGFRKITWFLDRPDVMAAYTTTLAADKARYPVLLSNGDRVAGGDLPGGRHFATWRDPFKKPSYLFALVAGDLARVEDSFTTRCGRPVALHLYVEPHNADQCGHALRSLKKAMAWDEETYGLEYDLDTYMIVAVDDFNMGAMENKGLNVFNAKYVLARPDTATDDDYQHIESVIGHEYFHNWTGNRVTCRDWFQLSLKEGLTVFREQEFAAAMGSRGVKRIKDVSLLRSAQFPQDAGPLAHPVRPQSYIEINNFYTTTVYNKGAEVIRMLQTLLGRDGFRRGMDLYIQRHDGQAVTTDDFVAAMADANGADLAQFRRWYDQAGTPRLEADGDYDPAAAAYTLTVRQSCPPTPGQPHKEPFHLPLAMGLLDSKGRDLPLRLEGEAAAGGTGRVLELRQPEHRFRFVGVPEAPVASLLRGFSAPVRLEMDHSDADLTLLFAHDSDDFNRWEAGQRLAVRVILGLVEARRQGRPWAPPEALAAAFARVLEDPGLDGAMAAQLLTLPNETWLAEQMAVVDVDGIHAAREFVRQSLAQSLRQRWLAVYEALRESGEYRIDGPTIGRRSLKNRCLDYLMQLDDPELRGRCLAQFRQAHNMTDVLAALGLLAHSDDPQRDAALAAFHDRWRHEPLVLDKWLTLQATAPRADTLERVRALLADPAFNIRNPNRVRALIGAFCHSNPVRFHALDGMGCTFLADHVLTLNALNPQVAARLLGAFTQWRKYDPRRQGLMRGALERILAAGELSPDVYEIAAKSLGAEGQEGTA
ncbi:MAG: aminopeptidase N [Pseudomonadota bacterium]|nr:aminopeptidase N [Pseudomonadota bacterium]